MQQSRQIELTIKTIQNIKIPLPPIDIQEQIIEEIEIIEKEISNLQSQLDQIPEQKKSILKKYL